MPIEGARAHRPVITISRNAIDALPNREIRRLCEKGTGQLRCGPHLYTVQWHGELAVVRSATASSLDASMLACLLNRRRRELSQEQIHKATGTDRSVRLNGKVAFERCPTQPIYCLHLALHWIGLFADGLPGVPDYTTLRTEEGLKTSIPFELHRRWPTNVLERGRLSVVMMEDWGKHFATRFSDLERRAESATAMLVLTPAHAMAVGLKIQRHKSRTLYHIHFYEPNVTASHAAVCFDELVSMEPLQARDFTNTACDFWPRNPEQAPVDNVDAMLFVEIGLAVLQELRSLDTTLAAQPRQLHGPLPQPTADALWYLLRYGCDDAIRQLAPAVRALPHGERVRRLSSHRATQPFFDVMTVGMPSTVALFGDLVGGLPVEQRASLLRSASSEGLTAFASALRWARPNIFEAFVKLLQRTLPSDYHYPLLAAALPDGTSGLHFAFETRKIWLLPALARALSTLPPLRLASLLCARSAANETGLEAAVRQENLEMIISFGEALALVPQAARGYLLQPGWRLARELSIRYPRWEGALAILQMQVRELAPHLLTAPQAPAREARPAKRRWRMPALD